MADTTAGTVKIVISSDTKGIKDGVEESKKAVGDLQKTASSKLAGVSDSFTNFGRAAFNAAKIAGVGALALAGGVLKSASDMQMLRSSFDVLTGSADEGAKVFKRLNDMAASTPFETTDLAKATQTMLAFGISADDSEKYLSMLGDVSMGNADKLGSLSLAFSQVQSTGRLMGQDLLQLVNQGFNPLTVISQQTGKSMSELRKDMEAGKISFEDVAHAFELATSEGGLFFEGMEKGSQTLQGRMSTLKDNLMVAARAVIGLSDTGEVIKGGLFDKVSMAVEYLIGWINEHKDDIVKWLDNTLKKFEEFWKYVEPAVNAVKDAIVNFVSEAENRKSLMIGVLTALTVAFGIWAVSVVAATWPVLAIIAGVTAVVMAFRWMWENNFLGIKDFLLKAWEDMKIVFDAVSWYIDYLKWGFKTMVDAVGWAISAVSSIIDNSKNKFRQIRDAITGLFSNIGDSIRDGIKAAINFVIRKFNSLGNIRIPVVDIDVSLPKIPELATGGIVPATPGGRIVRVAEGGEDEAIVPLSKMRSSGITIQNVNISDNMTLDIFTKTLNRRHLNYGIV